MVNTVAPSWFDGNQTATQDYMTWAKQPVHADNPSLVPTLIKPPAIFNQHTRCIISRVTVLLATVLCLRYQKQAKSVLLRPIQPQNNSIALKCTLLPQWTKFTREVCLPSCIQFSVIETPLPALQSPLSEPTSFQTQGHQHLSSTH